MKITRKNLDGAVSENIITAEQAVKLYHYLKSVPPAGSTFTFTNVLYYLGGLIAIGAMTVFMTLGWESFGGWGIFCISLVYAAIALKLANKFAAACHPIPAGICSAFVIALTPLAIYGLQQALGLWPDGGSYREYHHYIRWYWVYMEIGTLAVGCFVIWRYQYPFLIMPIAATLWYMSMDLAMIIVGEQYDYQFRAVFSMYFGLLIIVIAVWTDFKLWQKADYAFWLYIFGVMTFWCGMTAQEANSELSRLMYFCANLLMIAVGIVLSRRVFVIFGALGTCAYISYLAWRVFDDSWLFPIILTITGLSIMYLGVAWQKYETTITEKSRSLLPPALRNFLASRAD